MVSWRKTCGAGGGCTFVRHTLMAWTMLTPESRSSANNTCIRARTCARASGVPSIITAFASASTSLEGSGRSERIRMITASRLTIWASTARRAASTCTACSPSGSGSEGISSRSIPGWAVRPVKKNWRASAAERGRFTARFGRWKSVVKTGSGAGGSGDEGGDGWRGGGARGLAVGLAGAGKNGDQKSAANG